MENNGKVELTEEEISNAAGGSGIEIDTFNPICPQCKGPLKLYNEEGPLSSGYGGLYYDRYVCKNTTCRVCHPVVYDHIYKGNKWNVKYISPSIIKYL